MVDNVFYTQAIQRLRPGYGFTINDMDYSTLVFTDGNVNKPTELEIQTTFEQIRNDYLATDYQRKRVVEYPPIENYIDGVVKGDQTQIQTYINACLAVKEKYPKPTE